MSNPLAQLIGAALGLEPDAPIDLTERVPMAVPAPPPDVWSEETPFELAREAFLGSLRQIPVVSRACALTGISRRTVYRHRDSDAEFAAQWDDAIKDGVDTCKAEAHRRAFEGVYKPVIHKGVITDRYVEYSDTLAMFLLKSHDPIYRDRVSLEVNADAAQGIIDARKRAGLMD